MRARRCCMSPASATSTACGVGCTETTICWSRRRTSSAPPWPLPIWRSRTRRRHGLGARRGRHPCDPRPVSTRDGRPPDAERSLLRAWRRCRRRAGSRPRARARAGRRVAGRPHAARVDARGDAVDGPSARCGRDRRGADHACSLLLVGGSGSSGSAAPVCPRYAFLARAWGAEVGGWDRVETPYLGALERRRGRAGARAASCRRAGRSSSRRALSGRCQARRAASFLAELVSLQPIDRRRGCARKDDDDRDDRVRARRARSRPGVARSAARSPSSAGTPARERAGSSPKATSPTGRSSCCGRRSPS